MKRTKAIITLALLGALFTGTAARAAQVEERSLVDLFYTYTNDNVIVSYDDDNYLLSSQELQYKTYDGFLALSQTDLDWDGTEELLAIRLRPQEDEDGTVRNSVVAEVYLRQENTLRRSAQYTLAEGILEHSKSDVDVFAVNTQSGQLICCEARDEEALIADGVRWELRAAGFEEGAFYEVADQKLQGSDFTQEDVNGAYNAILGLGLDVGNPVWQMIGEQTESLGILCSIDRRIIDMDGASAYLEGGGTDGYLYGQTAFRNLVNVTRENKLPKEFAAICETPTTAVQTQTAPADGSGYSFAGDFVIPDSDSRYITEEELNGLSAQEIFLARNEIYARHGRIFNEAALDAYFRSKSWYAPSVSGNEFTDEYAAGVFNDYEIQNISTMVTYEKNHGLNGYE